MGFDKNQQIRMKHIALPDNIDRPLEFYLAMEEFVAREIDEDSAFFSLADGSDGRLRAQPIDSIGSKCGTIATSAAFAS